MFGMQIVLKQLKLWALTFPGDSSIPAELQTLLVKEFVFKLRLNKYNLVDGLQDYGVSAIFTPIRELESVYEKNALAPTSPNLVEFASVADNVPGGDNERKRKLFPIIEAVTGDGSGVP